MRRSNDLMSAFSYNWCCRAPVHVRRIVRTKTVRATCEKCKTQIEAKDYKALMDRWNRDVEKRRPPKLKEESNDGA